MGRNLSMLFPVFFIPSPFASARFVPYSAPIGGVRLFSGISAPFFARTATGERSPFSGIFGKRRRPTFPKLQTRAGYPSF